MLPFIIPIILSFSFVLPDGDGCENRLNGYYENGNIYICPQLSKEDKRFTYIHEYGHYVWMNKLTDAQQLEWSNFEDLDDINSYISDYAGFSILEDFSETFAYVLLKKEINIKNELIDKKIAFVKKVVSYLKK